MSISPDKAFLALRAAYRDAQVVLTCHTLALWDQASVCPSAGADHRAVQLEALWGLYRQQLSDPHVAEWLDIVEQSSLVDEPEHSAAIRAIRSDYNRWFRIPVDLAKAIARTSSNAIKAWSAAREAQDFAKFAPLLARMISLKQEEADHRREWSAPQVSRYDALLNVTEPGVTIQDVRNLLGTLHVELQALIERLDKRGEVPRQSDAAPIFAPDRQHAFVIDFARALGLDPTWGRVDPGIAPGACSPGHHDVRIVLRYEPDDPFLGISTAAHELGHAFYEEGLDARSFGDPVMDYPSESLTEAQARLWQAIICKLPEFCVYAFPIIVRHFGTAFASSPAELHAALTRAARSAHRPRTDDLTLCVHMGLRFEIEAELIEGSLAARDVPERWREKTLEYLGDAPTSPLRGALSDAHWAMNLYGVYPSYVLGSVYAAQLFAAMERSIPELRAYVARGHFTPIHDWLAEHIYRVGRSLTSAQLMTQATGSALDPSPWVAILRQRHLGPHQ